MGRKEYRKGAVGALMDEYERAAEDLLEIIRSIHADSYDLVRDTVTQDENCRSIQTIFSHVVSSGYSYADYLRQQFGIPSRRPERKLLLYAEALPEFGRMLRYTIETLENRWEMPDDEMLKTVIHSRWGQTYDTEQLLEHAIVHLLRHRRQLDKFLQQ